MIDPTPTSPPTTNLPSVSATIRSIHVEVVRGPDAGKELTATSERIVIGSHRTADLVLTDRTVSRFHVELVIEGDSVVLRDLGSRNGTLLDGVELEQGRLRGPTIVQVGSSELRIDVQGDAVPLTLAPQEQFGALIGAAAVMRLTFERLEQAARRDGHVLIEGERGTGKDAAAAALHERSARHEGPLDVIDCSGPALAVEEMLLGKGDRPGALERCHTGTLVLDEVGGLPRGTQRALVRALEDKCVRRRDTIAPADVRIIALSRRNLRVDVNDDRFAPDLFELLAGARVRLPPLRERSEDVPLLVGQFLGAMSATDSRAGIQLLAPESLEQLRASAWPGNVRELRAYVEQSVLAGGGPVPDDAEPPLIDSSTSMRDARQRWLRYFERSYVSELLAQTNGNVSAAAVLAGVDRVYMHRMITRCGLRETLAKTR
jgi:two-component system, NtrC family, response regulator GlrR